MLLQRRTGLNSLEGENLHKYVKECFNYSDDTGELTWREDRPSEHFCSSRIHKSWKGKWAGRRVGSTSTDGYTRFTINYKCYSYHRLVFLWKVGRWPTTVDHINGDVSDNSWGNLREVSVSTNCRNRVMQSNNTTGFTGITFRKRDKKWYATGGTYCPVKGKGSKFIGSFKNLEDAVGAREAWVSTQDGYTDRHGK